MRAFEKVQERTGITPTALLKQPQVASHLLEYWNGYVQLDRSREWSYGVPMGIRYAEIDAFARIHRFDAEDAVELATFVDKLDTVYLKWQGEHGNFRSQHKRKGGGNRGKASHPQPRRHKGKK